MYKAARFIGLWAIIVAGGCAVTAGILGVSYYAVEVVRHLVPLAARYLILDHLLGACIVALFMFMSGALAYDIVYGKPPEE